MENQLGSKLLSWVSPQKGEDLFSQVQRHLHKRLVLERKSVRQNLFETSNPPKDGVKLSFLSPIFYETGALTEDKKRYFFLKSANQKGWLFEEKWPNGLLVSRAEKILAQNLFLRERLPWDEVRSATDVLSEGNAGKEEELTLLLGRGERLVSQRDTIPMSLSLYLRRLENAIAGEGDEQA